MKKIINSKIFLVFFVVTFTISLFVFLNFSKRFQSQTDILLIPKNVAIAKSSDRIQNDIANIILSVKIYDQILTSENASTEITLGQKDSKKERDWRKIVSVKKQKNSNILSIFTYDKDSDRAEYLSRKVARNISDKMSIYYDIRKELDIRIIDGSISEKKSISSSLIPWILSLLVAFASGLFAFLVFNSVEFVSKSKKSADNDLIEKEEVEKPKEIPYVFPEKENKKQEETKEDLELFPLEEQLLKQKQEQEQKEKEEKEVAHNDLPIQNETIVEKQIDTEEKEEEISMAEEFEMLPLIEDELPEEIPEPIEEDLEEKKDTSSKKMAAPANLPIAESHHDLSLAEELEEIHDSPQVQDEVLEILEKAKEVEKPSIHEASKEEVKARLNKLLKGKL